MYDAVFNLIPCNEQQRITAAKISRLLGIKEAEVRHWVNRMRSSGVPVCSDRRGYYISNNAEHVKTQIASMENRISAMQNAIGGLNLFLAGKGSYVNT